MNLGRLNLKNNLMLAPMASYSDIGLRKICAEYGCSHSFTELIYTSEFVKKSPELKKKLDFYDKAGIQFVSNDPEELKKAILMIKDREFYDRLDNITSIDLNLGCPADQVMGENLGSALLNQPKLIRELFSVMKKNSDLPVSAKIRLAINAKHKKTKPYLRIARIAKEEGLDFITVHTRTAGQEYEGDANLNALKEIRENVDIPLVGNGGVHDRYTYLEMIKYCDAVMIGQHAAKEPFIFREILEPSWKFDREEEKITCIKAYLKYAEEYDIGFQHIKIHVQAFLKDMKGSEELIRMLTDTSTKKDILVLLDKYLS
jgi:tRNA-dihydrouridine synthase B